MSDGCGLQVPQRARLPAIGIRLGEAGLVQALDQHAPMREHLHEPGHDGVHQCTKLAVGRRGRLDEGRYAVAATPVHAVQPQATRP